MTPCPLRDWLAYECNVVPVERIWKSDALTINREKAYSSEKWYEMDLPSVNTCTFVAYNALQAERCRQISIASHGFFTLRGRGLHRSIILAEVSWVIEVAEYPVHRPADVPTRLLQRLPCLGVLIPMASIAVMLSGSTLAEGPLALLAPTRSTGVSMSGSSMWSTNQFIAASASLLPVA